MVTTVVAVEATVTVEQPSTVFAPAPRLDACAQTSTVPVFCVGSTWSNPCTGPALGYIAATSGRTTFALSADCSVPIMMVIGTDA